MSDGNEESGKEQAKRELAIVERHTNQLMEHFDTVQIFVTRNRPDIEGTTQLNWGGGNWFARYGQVRVWLIREDASLIHPSVSENDEDDDDE